jgi:hypothetical protein
VRREKLREGWRIRKANFSDDVYFYAPTLKRYETEEFKNSATPYFVPISVTGPFCSLSCDHCKAKILRSMYDGSTPDALLSLTKDLVKKGVKGLLVSGGCDREGRVPLLPFISVLKRIKEEFGLKILVHTGLVDEQLAKGLAKIGVEAAMIDIIGSDQTIHEVYHLKLKVSEFDDSIKHLSEYGVNVVPHLVIGLHYGKIDGEFRALELIRKHKVASLVLVGLLPQFGTPMEGVTPPPPAEMGEVFLYARALFPTTPILLGCKRMYGGEGKEIEKVALMSGLNGIAYPSDGVVSFARKLGLKPHFSELCCALLFEEGR